VAATPQDLKNFRETLFFRASASFSNFQNDKSIFSAVINFRTNSVFRASASCSKILNDKKNISMQRKIPRQFSSSGQAQVAQKS